MVPTATLEAISTNGEILMKTAAYMHVLS